MTSKDKLLTKLYNGTCSRVELHRLLTLLKEDSGNNDVSSLAELWDELQTYPEIDGTMASQMMKKLMDRVEDGRSKTQVQSNALKRSMVINSPRRQLIQFSYAAVLLILIGTICWFWLAPNKMIEVRTAAAEQKMIELPDHSLLKMNANSKISYRKNWSTSRVRQVWLEGEAYFEVTKQPDSGQKFEVITKDLTVEVLGTTFNINARAISTAVFLVEGQIRLDIDEQPEEILMAPGELVTYSKSTGKPLKALAESAAPASWKDGTIVMEDATLDEIIQKVHEIYDVNIIVDNDTYLGREFTVFLSTDDPDMGFNTLSGLGLRIIKSDKQWTIK